MPTVDELKSLLKELKKTHKEIRLTGLTKAQLQELYDKYKDKGASPPRPSPPRPSPKASAGPKRNPPLRKISPARPVIPAPQPAIPAHKRVVEPESKKEEESSVIALINRLRAEKEERKQKEEKRTKTLPIEVQTFDEIERHEQTNDYFYKINGKDSARNEALIAIASAMNNNKGHFPDTKTTIDIIVSVLKKHDVKAPVDFYQESTLDGMIFNIFYRLGWDFRYFEQYNTNHLAYVKDVEEVRKKKDKYEKDVYEGVIKELNYLPPPLPRPAPQLIVEDKLPDIPEGVPKGAYVHSYRKIRFDPLGIRKMDKMKIKNK